jgi:hypothetical protein
MFEHSPTDRCDELQGYVFTGIAQIARKAVSRGLAKPLLSAVRRPDNVAVR